MVTLDTISEMKGEIIGEYCNAIVDCTVCPVNRPSHFQNLFYSGKHKKHVLKYEVVVSLNGVIVWVSKSFFGKIHDSKVSKFSGIVESLGQEIILGDKAYIGDDNFLTPSKAPKTEEEMIFNNIQNRIRVKIENVFSAIKKFSILKGNYRGDLSDHYYYFLLICNLYNLELIE